MTTQSTIATTYRRIVSPIPHPDSLAMIRELEQLEPRAMSGFVPIIWDHALEACVFDAYGNQWIDFTSTVLVTNAGHSNPHIAKGIRDQLDQNMWHCYCNPSKIRLDAIKAMLSILPEYLNKIFLLTTGSEATECAIKLMHIHGQSIAEGKYHIVSYLNSFHGRTMAAQSAGGYLDAQKWMGTPTPGFHHIPFPGPDDGKEFLDRSLNDLHKSGLDLNHIAGFITETFQGPTVSWMPKAYLESLRRWCDDHQALITVDEMQAGFGRTGKWSGFEHYDTVEIDLACYGKGMTSSLPMSALVGRGAILDLPDHGDMSSTHTGNPLCAAAAIANIKAMREDNLVENAARLEPIVRDALHALRDRFPDRITTINGKGLVWAVFFVTPGTPGTSDNLDIDLATRVTTRCMETGLLMLQTHRGTLKIAPPLCITDQAVLEGISVIADAIEYCIRKSD
jgi:4-aminobutyrate aminotransferase-like enzyme